MLRKSTLLMLLALSLSFTSFAQEAWTLQKCIEHARQNNLTLRQSQIAVSQAELTELGSRKARLPNISGGGNFGYQFGLNIDPTTNDFVNTRIGFNNLQLNAGVVIYNGGRIKNTIKQSQYDLEAAKEDANTQFQNISLQMASAYLSILLAKEQVTIAQKAIEQTQEQLTQIDKRINAGTVPKADRLDIVAQIARNERVLVQAQNDVEINYLTLKNILELEPDYNLEIIIPDELLKIEETGEVYTLGTVYQQALGTQSSIKASEAKMKSAELNIPLAKAGSLPTLSAFGGLDTRWSSASRNVIGFQSPEFGDPTPVLIDNELSNVSFPSAEPILEDNPYFEQLDQNFGQSIGLSLNVPIYDNHRNKINVERAKLGILNAELDNRQAKQQLKADVQNAIAGARAARLELSASETSLEAAKAAYENAEKRYNLGAINTLELTTAKTSLDTAELNVASAKYDYVFRLKIIDFYLGKELKLN